MRNFLLGLTTMYLMTALLFSTSIAFSGPKAMNSAGIIYYGIVWPAWPISATVGENVVPIPTWAFTFNDTDPD